MKKKNIKLYRDKILKYEKILQDVNSTKEEKREAELRTIALIDEIMLENDFLSVMDEIDEAIQIALLTK